MIKIVLAFLFAALAPIIAFGQTHVGPTGSIITYNGGSESKLVRGIPTTVPFSIGAVIGEIGGDATRITFTHFQEVIDRESDNGIIFKQEMSWASYNAIRVDQEWAVPVPSQMFVKPMIGAFGGVSFVRGSRGANSAIGTCSKSEGPRCLGNEKTLIFPEPTRPKETGAYIGVTVAGKVKIRRDTEVEVAYDVWSTFHNQFHVNVNWFIGKK